MASQSTSLYDINRIQLWNAYSAYLQGSSSALFCVVSFEEVSLETRSAFLSVANRLGYSNSLCFITIAPSQIPTEMRPAPDDAELLYAKSSLKPYEEHFSTTKSSLLPAENTHTFQNKDCPERLASYPSLQEKELLIIIETLDPLCLVCCDQTSASYLATAYQCSIALETKTSLLNRPFRGFVDISRSLFDKEEKQKAWQLLKTLPSL